MTQALAQNSVQELFEVHGQGLNNFLLRRVRCAETAAELSQETFLRLLRMSGAHKIQDPQGFLFTVAANLARDHLRRQTRMTTLAGIESPDEDTPGRWPSPEAQLYLDQQVAILAQLIDALPPKTRAVFLLYRIEGRSYREIATTFQISERTVEYHIRQALIRCRRGFNQALEDV